MSITDWEEKFAERLTQLRMKKGVSARDMSLSLGQNPGYINNIENGKAMPSMACFFYICEYLNISPKDFFDTNSKNPEKVNALIDDLKLLDDTQFDNIASIVKALIQK
ncbi:MAG: helix-turn-helix transcriptional regulator [Ruminococcus sp.]|nr:helix-turn-helix transcriptional regulator [Ruminococcus sp.]